MNCKWSHIGKTTKLTVAIFFVCILAITVRLGASIANAQESDSEYQLPPTVQTPDTDYEVNYTSPYMEDDKDSDKNEDYNYVDIDDTDVEPDLGTEDYYDILMSQEHDIITPRGFSMDVTDQLNVTDFQLLLNTWWWGGHFEPVPPLAYGHVSPWNDIFAFRFILETNLQGGTLQSGDTARFRIPHIQDGHAGFINAQDSDWQNFYDVHSVDDHYDIWESIFDPYYHTTVLGRWRINAGHVEIEFTENTDGFVHVRAGFMMGPVLYSSVQTGGVRHINFGGRTSSVNFEARNWRRLPFSHWLTTEGVSPTHVDWRIDINREGLWEVVNAAFPGYGENIFGSHPFPITVRRDYVVEMELEGTFASAAFHARIARPLEIINSDDGYYNMPSSRTQPVDFSSHMTRVFQTSGEDYEDFKLRVMQTAFQWGVWQDDYGYQTVVVYFGRLGADGPRIIDADPNFINWVTNSAMVSEGWPSHYRDKVYAWFETLYGPGNPIGGRVMYPSIRIIEEHPPNREGQDVYMQVNSSYIRYGICWCEVWDGVCGCGDCSCTDPWESGFSRWSWAHLPPSDAWATGVPGGNQVRLYLYDQDTAARLVGGAFMLQSYVNGNWVDLRRFTTNGDGYFDANVGIGEFRFIQTDVADDAIYTLANSAHNSFESALGGPASGRFTVADGDTSGGVHLVFNTQNPFLTINIENENGSVLPGTSVVIRTPDNAVFATWVTGSDGRVRVQIPPNVLYEISATHPRYAPATALVSVGEVDGEATIVLSIASDNIGQPTPTASPPILPTPIPLTSPTPSPITTSPPISPSTPRPSSTPSPPPISAMPGPQHTPAASPNLQPSIP